MWPSFAKHDNANHCLKKKGYAKLLVPVKSKHVTAVVCRLFFNIHFIQEDLRAPPAAKSLYRVVEAGAEVSPPQPACC